MKAHLILIRRILTRPIVIAVILVAGMTLVPAITGIALAVIFGILLLLGAGYGMMYFIGWYYENLEEIRSWEDYEDDDYEDSER